MLILRFINWGVSNENSRNTISKNLKVTQIIEYYCTKAKAKTSWNYIWVNTLYTTGYNQPPNCYSNPVFESKDLTKPVNVKQRKEICQIDLMLNGKYP